MIAQLMLMMDELPNLKVQSRAGQASARRSLNSFAKYGASCRYDYIPSKIKFSTKVIYMRTL
jgi:aconitase B